MRLRSKINSSKFYGLETTKAAFETENLSVGVALSKGIMLLTISILLSTICDVNF